MTTLLPQYEFPITEKQIKEIYTNLINFYKHSNNPVRSGYPHFNDINNSMLSVCINKPYDGFGNQEIYPHVLHKAAVIIHSIVNYHPFIDGNKRMALLYAYAYL